MALGFNLLPADIHLKYNGHDGGNGDRVLQRVGVQKLRCDKCPYVTVIRNNFERHVLLHGCKHRFTCEYCDYSVPNFHRLLQHKKLHMMPNPNLLNHVNMQGVSHLTKLSEISADFPINKDEAATTNGVCEPHDDLDFYENSEEYIEPKKVYRCDRCPFTNARRDNLLAHLKFHMIRSALQCSYCDYSVSKQHLLTQHTKVHFTIDGQFKSASSGLPLNDNDGAESAQDLSQVLPKDDVKPDAKATSEETHSEPTEQPEYIDLSELAPNEDDNNNGEDSGKENQSQNEEGLVEKKDHDTSSANQYCDQTFQSSEKRQKHEMQHLVGKNY